MKYDLLLEGTLLNAARDMTACSTKPDWPSLTNLLLPIFRVVNVNRSYQYVRVERTLGEKDSAACKVEDVKAVCEGSCCRYSIASCKAITCHFPTCLPVAPGVPRLGTGLQVKKLMRVCVNRQ